jgi:tetrapyrrole methylase family protein/MazG family protein
MRELLERAGLRGSCQVHVAPLLLQPDMRAHQVFEGFSEQQDVRSHLAPLYPASTPVFVFADGRRSAFSLDEDWLWPEGSAAIVPAMRDDHPGGFYGLIWVMDRLLGPGGCPWDQEQTHDTLKRHLIEESYELLEAIEARDEDQMIEELGDVLLQPVFHGQIKHFSGRWTIEAPIKAITDKLLRRHPHVFGEATAADAAEVLANWDKLKAAEKAEPRSLLAGVPSSLPSLLRALEVSKRAARAGFEWPDLDAVWEKVREEEEEFREAHASGDPERMADEMGDWLFTLVQVARWTGIEPEEALRRMLGRFTQRFMAMESASPKPLDQLSPEEWDDLWNQAKKAARPPQG